MENTQRELVKLFEQSEFQIDDCSDVLCKKKLPIEIIQAAASKAFQNSNIVVVPELFKSKYLINTTKKELPSILAGEYKIEGMFKWRYDFLFYHHAPITRNIATFLYQVVQQSGYELVLDNFISRDQVSYLMLSRNYLKEIFLDYDEETWDITGIEKTGTTYWTRME